MGVMSQKFVRGKQNVFDYYSGLWSSGGPRFMGTWTACLWHSNVRREALGGEWGRSKKAF